MTRGESPALAAYIPAVSPAGPLPTIIKFSLIMLISPLLHLDFHSFEQDYTTFWLILSHHPFLR
jgi:hypothetical protein